MWTGNRSRADRILAAIEIPALGLWLGALCGFAFIFAPIAFRIVAPTDVGRFAALTSAVLAALAIVGYVCGGVAIVMALARSRDAGDRIFDFVRALCVAVALVLVWFQSRTIVPAMAAVSDVTSAQYHALHNRSTLVYGGVVVLGLIAIVMAAARREG
jgi:fatty acid desaturase